MGRHRRHPTDENDVKKPANFKDTETVSEQAEKRIGLDKTVCVDCSATNPENADRCRKCDGDVRPRNRDYGDE